MMPTNTPTGGSCGTCGGNGWKFVVHRSELRSLVQAGDASRTVSRRSCLDCGGSGRVGD